jgi:hypothetical protein
VRDVCPGVTEATACVMGTMTYDVLLMVEGGLTMKCPTLSSFNRHLLESEPLELKPFTQEELDAMYLAVKADFPEAMPLQFGCTSIMTRLGMCSNLDGLASATMPIEKWMIFTRNNLPVFKAQFIFTAPGAFYRGMHFATAGQGHENFAFSMHAYHNYPSCYQTLAQIGDGYDTKGAYSFTLAQRLALENQPTAYTAAQYLEQLSSSVPGIFNFRGQSFDDGFIVTHLMQKSTQMVSSLLYSNPHGWVRFIGNLDGDTREAILNNYFFNGTITNENLNWHNMMYPLMNLVKKPTTVDHMAFDVSSGVVVEFLRA